MAYIKLKVGGNDRIKCMDGGFASPLDSHPKLRSGKNLHSHPLQLHHLSSHSSPFHTEDMAIMCCIQVHPTAEMTVEEFKAWLRRFDSDRDGSISREELQEALSSLGVWFGWWKARKGMREADCDGSGRIDDAKEMEKLVQYAQHHLHMKISKDDW